MTKTSYDTAIKHLYRLNCETIVPQPLRSAIPRSNIHRWRKEPDGKYQGSELSNLSADRLDLLRQFAGNKTAQRAFRAFLRISLTVQKIVFSIKGVKETIRKNLSTIIETAEQARQTIGLKPILKLLDISRGTYDDWKSRAIHRCAGSPLSLCLRRHPQQLTGPEVGKMKSLLESTDFIHWPIASLAAHARRTNLLPLSDNSWYKYCRLLGIRRRPQKPDLKREGIRASRPDEFWHADVTEIRTADGVKHYLYLVADNFSRKILSWALSLKLRGAIRMETLREAFSNSGRPTNTTLVVDGGPENHNHTVKDFLSSPTVSIQMITAQTDVSFSNSLVEAVNKILKSRYIRLKAPPDGAALQRVLEWAIDDYNNLRPHTSLQGLTPSEVYSGVVLESLRIPEKVKSAQRARIQRNRQNFCRIGC
jgi:putative transposase